MSRSRQFLLSLLALGFSLAASAASPATQPKNESVISPAKADLFGDPDHLLLADSSATKLLTAKLTVFAKTAGLKLHVQLRAKFQPLTPGQRPGNLAAGIGRELHLTSDDILAVYFADTDKWGLWIGDHHVNSFVGRPGTIKELTKDGSFHHAKLVFIAAAQAQGVERANAAAQTATVSDVQKIQLQVAAMIDAFAAKYPPTPAP